MSGSAGSERQNFVLKKKHFSRVKNGLLEMLKICMLPAAIYKFVPDKEYRRETFERSSLYPRASGL
jgi:hypothetical protein